MEKYVMKIIFTYAQPPFLQLVNWGRVSIKLLLKHIRLKLQLVDGEVKRSKVQKIMKHCVRHISAAINRSASRNIFFKVTKMINLARHTQQNFSSSTFCDSTSSSASSSPDELVQQLELQIMNQDVIQT